MLQNLQKHLSARLVAVVFVVGFLLVDGIVLRQQLKSPSVNLAELPNYRLAELAQYDGSDPNKPVLLGYNGLVYDVSTGREKFYGPNKTYHSLVGKDSTALLEIAGGDIIRRKYQVVGKLSP